MRSIEGTCRLANPTILPERNMNIEVSKEELALLRSLLEEKWGDLRVEIRRTETPSYREQLRDLERATVALLRRCERAEAGGQRMSGD